MPDLDFSKPVTIFAPLAGYSDAPMREMVSAFGVDAVVSEMVASEEWRTNRRGVHERITRGNLAENTRYIVQIAGRDPEVMADAARYAHDQGAEQIDINMGCPAKKVVSGATAGAALLREPRLALAIIEAVAQAVPIAVSVKTRLGWDAMTTQDIAPDFENAGAQMLTIHGRTRQQKFRGQADWKRVGEIVARVNCPVIVNGDIGSSEDATKALRQSNADGVMIGRAAIGAPWLPARIQSDLMDAPKPDIAPVALLHFGKMLQYYGEEFGVLHARKHLKSYFSNACKNWLNALLRESNPDQVIHMLSDQAQSEAI